MFFLCVISIVVYWNIGRLDIINNHLRDYPSPINMPYTSHGDLAFISVEHNMFYANIIEFYF